MNGAALLFGMALVAAAPALGQEQGTPQSRERVSTALVMAVDVSESVSAERYRLQMEGIAQALEDEGVRSAIFSGTRHAIFITLVEWSNKATISIPWTLIASIADAQSFADRVRRTPRAQGEFTCMARAMEFVADKVLPFLPVPVDRLVLDVSGDGSDNCNTEPRIDDVKADLVATRVTINGLPILEGNDDDDVALEQWYRDHVIGGEGAFLIPAKSYGDFPRALRQKFVAEIAGWLGVP